jgi:hypothetical protein
MAAGAPAGSRPTSGGNKRPDGVANQNAGKKNARQIDSAGGDRLHLMRSCTVMGNLTNGLRARYIPRRGIVFREESNDYYKIRAMLPAGFPDKDDVVSAIFEDLLTGALRRDDVRARMQSYITAHNRMFPKNTPSSAIARGLDEVLFDRTATRGDSVSRGLWD